MPRGNGPIVLAGGSWGESLLNLLWVLVCAVLIIGLAYWFTRYVVGRGKLGSFGATRGTEQLQVLARLTLGREQAAVLVQAGERYFLLGVTPSAVSTLAELTAEEAQAMCPPPSEQPQPPSFREALHTVLQQRKKR